jgi:hypothetical protein
MPLGLRCPACQQAMRVPDHAQGRRVECPFCKHEFRFTGQKNVLLGRVPEKGSKAIPTAAPIAAAMAIPVAAAAAGIAMARPARAEVIELNELPGARPPEADVALPEVVGETQPREWREDEGDDIRPVTFPEDAVVENLEEAVEADLAEDEVAEAELAEEVEEAELAEAELAEEELADEAEVAEAEVAEADVAKAESAEPDFAALAEADLAEPATAAEIVDEGQFAEVVDADLADAAEAELAEEAELGEAEVAEAKLAEAHIEEDTDPLMAAAAGEMAKSEPEADILEAAEAEIAEADLAEEASLAEAPTPHAQPLAAPVATDDAEDLAFAEAMAVLSADSPPEPADAAAVEEAEALFAEEADLAEAEIGEAQEAELFVESTDVSAPLEPTMLAATPLMAESHDDDAEIMEEAALAEAVFESEPAPSASSMPTPLPFEDSPAAVIEEAEIEEDMVVAEEEEAPKPKRAAPVPPPAAEEEVDLNEIFGSTEIEEPQAASPAPGAVFDDEPTETMDPVEADQLFEDDGAETENVAPKKSKGKDNETGKKKGWKLW